MTRLASVAVGGKVTATIENADRAGINKAPQLMTPTSVSTGSIGTYGAVTFSAASSISLNGCFTSEFDWYIVEFDLTSSGSATMRGNLRLSGTDAATAYDNQRVTTVNSTATADLGLNGAGITLTNTAMTGGMSGSVKLFNPFLAVATRGTTFSTAMANPATTSASSQLTAGWQHRTTTAYDGFTITPSTGNITGTVRVYGII